MSKLRYSAGLKVLTNEIKINEKLNQIKNEMSELLK